MSPQTALNVHIDMQDFASQERTLDVALASDVPIEQLISLLIALLCLPVTYQGIPLLYFLTLGDRRLHANKSLMDQGVVNGNILALGYDLPAERPFAWRIRDAGIGNVRWHCFVSHQPCECTNLRWDPSLVPVFLSPDYTKSESVWKHTIDPAIRGVGLSPRRVQDWGTASSGTRKDPAPAVLKRSSSECRAAKEGCEELSLMCRHAQQGLLSVVDLTDARDSTLLALGMLWGLGQPTVVLLKENAHVPVHLPRHTIISYREPGEAECISQIRKALQKRTGIAEIDGCYACGDRFTPNETMIVCVACRAQYHTRDWSGVCTRCHEHRHIRL